MSIDWKKSAIIVADIAIAAYLLLAVTAFNRPDELNNVCSEVNINIQEGPVRGFLNADEVKTQLIRTQLYPLGDPIDQVEPVCRDSAMLQDPDRSRQHQPVTAPARHPCEG